MLYINEFAPRFWGKTRLALTRGGGLLIRTRSAEYIGLNFKFYLVI